MADGTENIERLTASLKKWASKRKLPVSGEPKITACRAIADAFPLSHCTAASVLADIQAQGAFKSKRRIKPKAEWQASRENARGTVDDVFFYVAELRFPAGPTSAGILFRAALETSVSGGRACPFDTGGLGDSFSIPGASASDVTDIIRAHEMPAPGYRGFFDRWIDVCYEEPLDYLSSPEKHRGSPIGLALDNPECDCRAWTFEVRFPREVPVEAPIIEAVFIHDERITDPRIETLAAWASAAKLFCSSASDRP